MPKITFVKEKKTIEVEPGTNLRKAMMQAGIPIYGGIQKVLNCHGFGHCAGCRVHIKKGMENVSHMGLLEKANPLAALSRIGHESEARLACRCEVNGDIEVESTPGLNWHGEHFWS